MNKKMSILACTAAVIGMGMGMPQCPGEKALQDQIEGINKTEISTTQKVNALNTEVKAVSTDMGQVKQAITQLAGAVDAQKDAINRLNEAVKDLQAKVAAAAKPVKAKGKRKGH